MWSPELPQGYQHDYMGEARQYVQEGNALMYTFPLALCVIFLVLAAQFESWRDPLVIMVSVPWRFAEHWLRWHGASPP